VKNVYHVQPEDLKKRGIKGVITDLDNTFNSFDVVLQIQYFHTGQWRYKMDISQSL